MNISRAVIPIQKFFRTAHLLCGKIFVFATCFILSDYEHGEKHCFAYNEAISNTHKKKTED